MENVFKELCRKVDSDEYDTIRRILRSSTAGLIVGNNIITRANPYSGLSLCLSLVAFLTLTGSLTMTLSHGCIYTKNIDEIRVLYQEFIKNYDKLNKVFDLNNPIEIYTMFHYLLYKGYLSKDQQFSFNDDKIKDIYKLWGANVFSGAAACRHISSMLTDILKQKEINAKNLSVYVRDNDLHINILDEPKCSREELIDWVRYRIKDEKLSSLMIRAINATYDAGKGIDFVLEEAECKNPAVRYFGNHLITAATQNEKMYFLDPTQGRIYHRLEENGNDLFDDRGRVSMHINKSILFNSFKENHQLRKMLSQAYPSVSGEEEQKLVNSTMNKMSTNTDILERFYRENKGIYEDVSNGLSKIKRRII